jgi:hypothetical protein
MNAEVIALAAVDRKPLAGFARELKLPFPVLSDVTGEVYRAFGLGKGMVIRPHTLLAAARLVWHAKRLYRPVGTSCRSAGISSWTARASSISRIAAKTRPTGQMSSS